MMISTTNCNAASAMSEALRKALGMASAGLEAARPDELNLSAELEKSLAFVEMIKGVTNLVADQSNIFRGSRDKDFQVDWTLALNLLSGNHLNSAGIVVSQAPVCRPQQDKFYEFLTRTGWRVYRHLVLENSNGTFAENEPWVDGDVRKLIRAAADSPECESVVVLSGDGGMTNAVRYARKKGKQVYIVAWSGTLHPALAAAATAHVTVEELRPLIGRILH